MKPLEGIRVVGFTHIAAGPFCLSLLGDLGADVVNIEPLSGENMRQRDDVFGDGDSAYFHGVNRSKSSIALNAKSLEGREVVERLVKNADVFIHNYRLQGVRSLHLEYATLSKLNPRLVYCGISAWGKNGPKAEEPGMDLLVQAFSGLMYLNAEPDGFPVRVPAPVCDMTASYLSAFGIMVALWARERTGKGQEVDISLLGAITATMANVIPLHFRTGGPKPTGSAHPQIVPYQAFHTQDGMIYVACLTQQFWVNLCTALDRLDLQEDPRFSNNAVRLQHRDELISILAPLIGSWHRAPLLDQLRSFDVPAEAINSLGEALNHPQAKAIGLVETVQHTVGGAVHVTANPLHFSDTPGSISRPAQLLGQSNHEVLSGLGYSLEEIEALEKKGIVRQQRLS